MASVSRLEIVNQNVTAAISTAAGVRGLEVGSVDFVGVLVVSNYVSGTFTTTLEHSADKINWTTFASFAAIAADGHEYIDQSNFTVAGQNLLPNVRAQVAGAGLDADLLVALYYDKRK